MRQSKTEIKVAIPAQLYCRGVPLPRFSFFRPEGWICDRLFKADRFRYYQLNDTSF